MFVLDLQFSFSDLDLAKRKLNDKHFSYSEYLKSHCCCLFNKFNIWYWPAVGKPGLEFTKTYLLCRKPSLESHKTVIDF
jgi:hypothetical protein